MLNLKALNFRKRILILNGFLLLRPPKFAEAEAISNLLRKDHRQCNCFYIKIRMSRVQIKKHLLDP